MNTDGDKRIVLVSSNAASQGLWDPNNLQGDSGYARLKFYGNSKLYMVSRYTGYVPYLCVHRPGDSFILNLKFKQICKPRYCCLLCSRYRMVVAQLGESA